LPLLELGDPFVLLVDLAERTLDLAEDLEDVAEGLDRNFHFSSPFIDGCALSGLHSQPLMSLMAAPYRACIRSRSCLYVNFCLMTRTCGSMARGAPNLTGSQNKGFALMCGGIASRGGNSWVTRGNRNVPRGNRTVTRGNPNVTSITKTERESC